MLAAMLRKHYPGTIALIALVAPFVLKGLGRFKASED